MKPGVTIAPLASTTRAEAGKPARMVAVVPTAATCSPETAMASAHGLAESPVHTRALTMASVTI